MTVARAPLEARPARAQREARREERRPPERSRPHPVLALQRGAGNAAVAQLLRKDKDGDPPRAGGWNETTRDYRQDICIHRLFELQAERIFEQARHIVAGTADAGGRTARRIVSLAQLVEGFRRRIAAHK